MPSHLALLRGINVGGRGKVAMADLRELFSDLGFTEVTTYIQSGNVVFNGTGATGRMETRLDRTIEERLGVRTTVVVLTRARLAAAIAANPFPEQGEPKQLHAVFRRGGYPAADVQLIAGLVERARAKCSRDQATVVDDVLYLHTPDGMGRSELAVLLQRSKAGDGTARNWATVTRLAGMLEG
jgi:uncharacterized protein (DUF1697 family)